jgi:C-terminal processing protease CtpA/Prc
MATLAAGPAAAQLRLDPNEPPLKIDAATRAEVITALAKELEGSYVFPDVAGSMAKSIREKAAAGAYDKCDTGQAFARQLTDDLQAISKDKHLRVLCSTRALPKMSRKVPTAEEVKKRQHDTQRRNSGFVKLERLPGNIGYLELRGFADPKAGAQTVAAVMSFLAHSDALIIDLRRNGGGSAEMVQLVCSYLFPADQRVHLNSLYWREGNRTEEFWTLKDVPGPRYLDRDVYVMTSHLTFSGAEEFAYNLQTRKRATVVGETTGGGAHPGKVVPLNDHFMAFVSTGRAINPVTKTNWEGTGVKPDVAVNADEALEVAVKLALEKLKAAAKDPQARDDLERELRAERLSEERYKERKGH